MPKLQQRYVEKLWGRDSLPATFPAAPGKRVGEIWYEGASDADLPLLVKYIFTSERLSIQVHPNDDQAKSAGLRHGKEESWYILDCEPGASIGVGLTRNISSDEFTAAAKDGSLEHLIDWRPVKPGDYFFIPAGTVHAIGAGIALAEVQQNVDVTYRLFDYGRPRELHLEEGKAVSTLERYTRTPVNAPIGTDRLLADGSDTPFWLSLAHWDAGQNIALPDSEQIWFVPLTGSGEIDGERWQKGECWLVNGHSTLTVLEQSDGIIAGMSRG